MRRKTLYSQIYCLFLSGIVLPTKYLSGDQNEKNGMGVACSTYGGQERRIQDFGGKTYRKEPGVDGRIIIGWIFRKWNVGV